MALLAMYIWTYYRHPKNVEVLQISLSTFHFDMLREKQPIIVDDRVVSLQDIGRLWFKHNIVSSFRLDGSSIWHKNKFKYAVLRAEQEGDIYMYPVGKPMTKDSVPDTSETLMAVHMLPGQVIVLPYRWHYLITEPMQVDVLGVHDYITYILPA